MCELAIGTSVPAFLNPEKRKADTILIVKNCEKIFIAGVMIEATGNARIAQVFSVNKYIDFK